MKLLIDIIEKLFFEILKKNYQLFRITDDRNIRLILNGTEAHYQLNFRRVHIDPEEHRGTTRNLAGMRTS